MKDFMTDEEWNDIERRLELIEEAVEGMKNTRAMRFLLSGMQEHINKRVPEGSMRSEQQKFLYAMIQRWKLELKHNKDRR